MLTKHATILVQIQPIGFMQSVTFYNYNTNLLDERYQTPGISITITLQPPGQK